MFKYTQTIRRLLRRIASADLVTLTEEILNGKLHFWMQCFVLQVRPMDKKHSLGKVCNLIELLMAVIKSATSLFFRNGLVTRSLRMTVCSVKTVSVVSMANKTAININQTDTVIFRFLGKKITKKTKFQLSGQTSNPKRTLGTTSPLVWAFFLQDHINILNQKPNRADNII